MQRMKTLTAIVLGVLLGSSTIGAAAADDWRIYQNDRYGTTVDYPTSFRAMPPPDNDDGRAFKNADGGAFSVFASYGGLDFDLVEFRDFTVKNLAAGSVVTYQASGDDWFVISGTRGGAIFYERYLLSHGGEMTEGFVISYPATLKKTYDPIVARMAKSFRSGTSFQTR